MNRRESRDVPISRGPTATVRPSLDGGQSGSECQRRGGIWKKCVDILFFYVTEEDEDKEEAPSFIRRTPSSENHHTPPQGGSDLDRSVVSQSVL